MTENNHLDIGAIMETDYWYEEIDTSCPFCSGQCPTCNGEGEIDCLCCQSESGCKCSDADPDDNGLPGECNKCNGSGTVECPDCDGIGSRDERGCEHCDSFGNFEIMWNTAFRIPYLKTGLDFTEARTLAWSMGWLLFRYDDELWVAAGSCGYDFTWVKARCALALCGDLPYYYAEQLQSGGHVFVTPEERTQIATAAAEAISWQIKRLSSLQSDMQKIASYGAEVRDIYTHERQIEEADRLIKKQAERNTPMMECVVCGGTGGDVPYTGADCPVCKGTGYEIDTIKLHS